LPLARASLMSAFAVSAVSRAPIMNER
jgi:hypothetical protein